MEVKRENRDGREVYSIKEEVFDLIKLILISFALGFMTAYMLIHIFNF